MTILKLDHVSLSLPHANHIILNNINYDVRHHDFIILLGGNGSGKSSLLKLIYRDYQASAGHLYLLDKLINTYPEFDFSCRVAVLTQNANDSLFTSLTVYENYLLTKHQHKQTFPSSQAEREYVKHYLADFNPNLATKLDNLTSQLSGGEKQALALGLCLLKKPNILLLDEHTSALDPKTSKQIMALTHKMITEHRITCILTTHDLQIAMDYGNRILVLREGEIYKPFESKDKTLITKEILAEGCY
jgi:putative ABC transport system ATP-binding protein